MLLGRYKDPKVEKRIFMFLDLKSSISNSETLGHYKYSKLIQDCFYDINDVVPKYDAEIYQYVGDEAVLSWPYKKGLANKNCVALFFDFQHTLKLRPDYYESKYGLKPEFKAGLHEGKLMVAEVRVVKKELAFQGDVINTSARIQAECNTHNVGILISERLKIDLNLNERYTASALGSVLLKGKLTEIQIFYFRIIKSKNKSTLKEIRRRN
jgi:adenylate cyclase